VRVIMPPTRRMFQASGRRRTGTIATPRSITERLFWSGGVTDTSFRAAMDLSEPGYVKLGVSTSSSLTNLVFGEQVECSRVQGASGTWYNPAKVEITGLQPDTQYYCVPIIDGERRSSKVYRVKTFPDESQPANGVKLGWGSCNNITSLGGSFPIASAIATENCRLFVHMGDIHYLNPSDETDPRILEDGLSRMLRSGLEAPTMLENTPFAVMFDNHDASSATDGHWDSTYTMGTHEYLLGLIRDNYDRCTPCYDYVETSNRKTATQAFNVGSRCRFWLADVRSQRRNAVGTHTILGIEDNPPDAWDQLSAVKADMLAAQARGVRLYGFITPSGWMGTTNNHWNSARYDNERDDLVTWIGANLTTMKVVIFTGDLHFSAVSDGENMPGEIPMIMSSPLFQTGGDPQGIFTVNDVVIEVDNASKAGRYVTTTINDDGNTLTLDVAIKGYPLTGSTPTTNYSGTLTI
jgi:hypothetical protein